jgi:HSP20 family protein
MTTPSTQAEAPEATAARTPERTRSERYYQPPTDIYETADAIILVADMPGVGADGVSVELEGSTLTISGAPAHWVRDAGDAVRHEYRPGGFERAFTLSDTIERKGIGASIKDGVLTLVLPKAAPAKARQIQVEAG